MGVLFLMHFGSATVTISDELWATHYGKVGTWVGCVGSLGSAYSMLMGMGFAFVLYFYIYAFSGGNSFLDLEFFLF